MFLVRSTRPNSVFYTLRRCLSPYNSDASMLDTFQFGIIAAISRNRVIGIDGSLPWKIKKDFDYFKDVTRDKIVIVGKRSYEENEWMHSRRCIVVSTSMKESEVDQEKSFVARSFNESLRIAKSILECEHAANKETVSNISNTDNRKSIGCWVIGGESIYEEALQHSEVQELRLTRVHIDVTSPARGHVARFPPAFRWDNRFQLVKYWNDSEQCQENQLQYFTFNVYRRIANRNFSTFLM